VGCVTKVAGMAKGGWREGSGAKPKSNEDRRHMISIRLPHHIVAWLKSQSKSQSVLIETALVKQYKIKKGD